MPSGVKIEIKSSPILKEWVVSAYGSDTIALGKHDYMTIIIRPFLCLVPNNHQEEKPFYECSVYLDLPWLNKHGINVLYRNFLDEIGQKIVEQHLYSLFKEVFYNFVYAGVMSGLQQKEAINNFCEAYKIELNETKYEMLKKSWDRSKQKKRIKKT